MKNIIKRLLLIGSFAALVGGVALFSLITYYSFSLPKIANLADYRPALKSQIISKDGEVLGEIGLEDRDIVEFKDIPPKIVDAFLSAEDSGFYEHTGVDYFGVVRAMFANLKAGRVVQGGSTITQQVAKSLLLTRERSIARKIKDFLLAQKIEKRFSKEEILFLYLNQVYLGGGYYGIKAAFKGYFEKDLSEATNAEAALIAGLLVAPGKYSPYVNPQYAKKRQSYVLSRMHANGKISDEEYKNALEEKIKYRLRKPSPFKAPYFTEHVRQVVSNLVGNDNFLQNGFKVITTLDYDLQKVAEKAVVDGTRDIDKRQGFVGPKKNISDSEEELVKYYQEFRKKYYQEQSLYFTLSEENTRVYEIDYSENELLDILSKQKEVKAKFYSSRFQPGVIDGDKLYGSLELNKKYEAVVLSTDDAARIIYVSIAGVTGAIPYRYFNWAHERIIQEERNFFPFVTRPSTIVKKGDVILVEVVRLKSKFRDLMYETFKSTYETTKDKETLDEQIYVMCSLEQEVEAQGSLLSLNPHTGEIVSMVGGVDFDKSKFNRALQSKRQPGSSFKPLLFAAGLENGYTPSTIILDTPEALGGNDENLNWKPRNYDGGFKGPMTFRESLELSRNIPTIKMSMDLGIPKIFKFLERIDFKAEMPRDMSIALGSFGATLLKMVEAYAIFPSGGKKVKPKFITSIVDRDGKEYIYDLNKVDEAQTDIPVGDEENKENENKETKENIVENKKEAPADTATDSANNEEELKNPYTLALSDTQVYDPRLSYIMTNLLRGVIQNGTGKEARRVSNYIGGKTGTTNNYVDAWFMGFSQNIVTGVWTGMDNNMTMGWGETGAKSALPIWADFMQETVKKYGESDFKVPLGIVNVLVNKSSGKLTEDERDSIMESFVEGTEPGNKNTDNFFKKKENSNNSKEIFEDDEFFNNQ